jgi:hypothetical protein
VTYSYLLLVVMLCGPGEGLLFITVYGVNADDYIVGGCAPDAVIWPGWECVAGEEVTGGSCRRLMIVSKHGNLVLVGADGGERVRQTDGVSRGMDTVVDLFWTA